MNRRALRTIVASLLVSAMVLGLLSLTRLSAAQAVSSGSSTRDVPTVKALPAPKVAARTFTGERTIPTPKSAFPAAASTTAQVPASGKTAVGKAFTLSGARTKAGKAVAADVIVQILDRAAATGQAGATAAAGLTLAPAASPAASVVVQLDYSGFEQAFGGDYAGRLRLATVPACQKTTPAKPACAPQELKTTNTVANSTLSATVPLATSRTTSVVALAGAAGQGGDYRATQLSPSDSWDVSENTGSFTYSYPISAPAPIGGSAPSIALTYDSGRVDGKTSADNAQTSMVGQGWEFGDNYIERVYRSCAVESVGQTSGDLCWGQSRYVLHLNGRSAEMIPVANNEWRLKDDPGWKIMRGLNADNGDQGGTDVGEYYNVQMPDGTDFTFGYGKTYGATPADTNSVWTVPVFGDDSGEPCHDTTFAASYCQQAYRWNLDRVIDDNGNVQSWTYQQEVNKYRRNGTNDASYVRGGNLVGILYGYHSGGTGAIALPTNRLNIRTVPRCMAAMTDGSVTCPAQTTANEAQYPDVPLDLACSANCTEKSPTFWTSNRLWQIETQRLNQAGNGWLGIDMWTLEHGFPEGDPGVRELWFQNIRRTGMAGSSNLTLPPTDFIGAKLDNRVDITSTNKPLAKFRIAKIVTDLGGVMVPYLWHQNDRGCNASEVSGYTAQSHDKECFRRYWTPDGGSPQWGWFHKYVTIRTEVMDPGTGSVVSATPLSPPPLSEPQITTYEYVGAPAWHYDDDITMPQDKQSWSDWRGYGTVITHFKDVNAGVMAGDHKAVESTYYRGMHGDRSSPTNLSATKTVYVATNEPSPENSLLDYSSVQGRLVEQHQLDLNGYEVGRTFYKYLGKNTADAPDLAGFSPRDAWMVQNNEVRTRMKADDVLGKVKRTVRTNFHDFADTSPVTVLTGLPSEVIDSGDEAVTGDETCTKTIYRYRTAFWMAAATRVQEFDGGCTGGTEIGRTDTWYTGQTAVAQGDDDAMTRLDPVKTVRYRSASQPITTTATYDAYGRVTRTTDGKGYPTTVAYAPTTGLPTSSVTTGPKPDGTAGDATTQTSQVFSTVSGLVIGISGPNGDVTNIGYDSLQRLAKVQLPEHQASGLDSLIYEYRTSTTTPTRMIERSLQSISGTTGTYRWSYSFIDGLGRPVQTMRKQGSLGYVSLTRYDELGREFATSSDFEVQSIDGAPNWVKVAPDSIPNETRTKFTTLGAVAASSRYASGVLQWETGYSRDANNFLEGKPASAITDHAVDARGRITQIEEQTTSLASFPRTKLEYDAADRLTKVTSPKNQVSTYTYDWLGQRLSSTDADLGATSTQYDNNGNVISSTDARGTTVQTDFDGQNRPTRQYTGTTTLATWTYDSLANGKGRLTSATAKIVPPGGSTPLDYTRTVTGYDIAGQPTGMKWTVPVGFGVTTAQNYTETYGYDAAGHTTTQGIPATGGIPAETMTATWNTWDKPLSLSSSSAGALVASTTYDELMRPSARQWQSTTGPKRTWTYDALSRPVNTSTVTTSGGTVQNDTIAYTGPMTTRLTDAVTSQRQCFDYNDLRQLTHAWTTNVNCTDGNAPNRTFGPSPYDQKWTFDADNSLVSATEQAGATRSVGYSYPGTDTTTIPIHAASSVAVTGTGAGTTALAYDNSGYLLRRTPSAGAVESLTWDALHRLSTSADSAGTTRFAYDADGSRLIRQTPSETTLTMGATDLVFPAGGGTATARRNYTLGGVAVALATTGSPMTRHWLLNDGQSSTELAIDSASQAVTRTRYTPYGTPRGTSLGLFGTGLPTDEGWLGKTFDKSTGLNHLGARYYDSDLGTFTAPDPLFDPKNPRSINPYTYSYGNPVMLTDGTGLEPRPWHNPAGNQCGNSTSWECNPGDHPTLDGNGAPRDSASGQSSRPVRNPASRSKNIAAGRLNGLWKGFWDVATVVVPPSYRDMVDDWQEEWRLSLEKGFGADPNSLDYQTNTWITRIGLNLVGGASGIARGSARLGSATVSAASKFGSLEHAGAGIAPFSTQRLLTAGRGGAIQAHHLIERRFARQIGGNTDDWPTIVVTRPEHQVFTNAWRKAISYGAGTRTATRAQIEGAAREIYAEYPEIVRALGL